MTYSNFPISTLCRHDSKISVRRLCEYDDGWFDYKCTVFLRGKPDKEEITDHLCRIFTNDQQVIMNAEFDSEEIEIKDIMKYSKTH